jgi:16S rRNA (adenine1518-N6/adenine1519-N6)-dimethyltransferase
VVREHPTAFRPPRRRVEGDHPDPRHLNPRESQSSSGPAGPSRARPQKRFGQHFLTDPNLLRKIVRAADIQPDDVVLEIGPGQGHLSRALLQAGARIVAVEIDRVLATRLRLEFEDSPALTVLQGDFLTLAPEEWLARARFVDGDYKVVANLPYYITSAILRHLFEAKHKATIVVVMVQLEVAREITAKPNQMSLLAVSVQFYGHPHIVSTVPAGAFYPRPRVDSAIVRVEVDNPSPLPEVDSRRFFEIVRAGFSVRRKQLHNALASGLKMNGAQVSSRLLRAGIDPRRRAETLSLEDWRRVYGQFM